MHNIITEKEILLKIIKAKGDCIMHTQECTECPILTKICAYPQPKDEVMNMRYKKAITMYINKYNKEDLIAELI